jgi:hypothetical protein
MGPGVRRDDIVEHGDIAAQKKQDREVLFFRHRLARP